METLKKDKGELEENGFDDNFIEHEEEEEVETIGNIFVKYLKSSTIRGLPAIVKEPSCGWKFIYLIAVLTFTAVCCVFLKITMKDYLQYKQLMTEEIPKEDRNYFPSVTVCDVRDIRVKAPQYWRSFRKERVKRINEFFDKSKLRISDERKAFYKRRAINFQFQKYLAEKNVDLDKLDGKFIYKCEFSNINKEDSTEIGNLFARKSEPCNVTKYRLQDQTACYMVEQADPTTFHPMLNIILYVKEKFTQKMYDYDDLFNYCQASLARVFSHTDKPISKVNAYCNGDTIEQGTKSILNLNAMIQYNSPTPISTCLKNPPNIILNEGQNYTYTVKRCTEVEFQKMIVKNCNCYSHELPVPEGIDIKRMPSCLNTNRNSKEYKKALSCLDRIIVSEGPVCIKPCTDIRYSSSTVVRDWPSISEGVHLYNNSIKNTKLGKKFTILKKPILAKNYDSDPELLEKVNKGIDLIGKSFAKVTVKIAVGDIRILRHELSSNWVSVMSKVGGQMYLWIGFTFIAIVEIIQLICDILTFACSEKKGTKKPKKYPPKKLKTARAEYV